MCSHTHLQVLQPLLQGLEGLACLLSRKGPMFATTVGPRPPVVWVWPVAIMGVVGVRVVVGVMVGVVRGARVVRAMVRRWPMMVLVVVVVTNPATKALAESELGRQLSDGLPLVQNGLLLPHQALPQVQDGGFSLVRHDSPCAAISSPSHRTVVPVTVAVTMDVTAGPVCCPGC